MAIKIGKTRNRFRIGGTWVESDCWIVFPDGEHKEFQGFVDQGCIEKLTVTEVKDGDKRLIGAYRLDNEGAKRQQVAEAAEYDESNMISETRKKKGA